MQKKELSFVSLMRVFGNASMILIFLMYQTILTQCIATFNCVSITRSPIPNDATSVLQSDVRVECSGTYYEIHVALAAYGVGVYAMVLPLITMSLVLRQARSQGWSMTYQQFAFLIKGFRLKFWFWEFVVVFRKTVLRMLIATVNDPTLQALLGIWFLTALFVAQTFAKPFVLSMHNHAEQLSLMTALITLNIGLAFRSTSSSCGLVCGVFSILLVALNVGVIVFFLVAIGFAVLETVIEMFGIDNDKGERKLAIRNLKNYLVTLFNRREYLSPSFRTYTPKFIDAKLAMSVLGIDTIPDGDLDEGRGAVVSEDEEMRRRQAKELAEEAHQRLTSPAASGGVETFTSPRTSARRNSIISAPAAPPAPPAVSAGEQQHINVDPSRLSSPRGAGKKSTPTTFMSIRHAMAARRGILVVDDDNTTDVALAEEMRPMVVVQHSPPLQPAELPPLPPLLHRSDEDELL